MKTSKEGWVRFSIRETDEGWVWSTRDYFDRPRSRGVAASKVIAAAMVVREIAMSAGPTPATENGADRRAA